MIPEMAYDAPDLIRRIPTRPGIRLLAGLYFILILFFLPSHLYAQTSPITQREDRQAPPDLIVPTDTVPEPEKKLHSPLKAAMLSAALPGLGQIYNRKYLKVPPIYALYGGILYAINFNNTEYQRFRRAWIARVDGNPNTISELPSYSDDRLSRAMNYYRRNLELSYILAAGLYILNVLDATVDAHLLDFDVSDDLTLNIRPVILQNSSQPMYGSGVTPGIGLSFRF